MAWLVTSGNLTPLLIAQDLHFYPIDYSLYFILILNFHWLILHFYPIEYFLYLILTLYTSNLLL